MEKPPKLECGDIVFFKICTRTNRVSKNTGRWAFKGHGFGIYFGALPILARDPSEADIMSCMAAIGFISFDDIIGHLGQEVFDDLVKKMNAKLAEQIKETAEKVEEPLRLVDARGLQLVKEESNEPIV